MFLERVAGSLGLTLLTLRCGVSTTQRTSCCWSRVLYSTSASCILSQMEPTPKRCIIIDTDVGWDDLVAIQALLDEPTKKIALMTTIHGCSSAYMGHQILQTCFPDILCVAGEEESPEIPRPEWVDKSRQEMEAALLRSSWTSSNNDEKDETTAQSACQAIVDLCFQPESEPTPIFDLLCLGPLTNVAYLMQHNADIVDQYIDQIYIMGGTLDALVGSEFNFDTDRASAVRVLKSSFAHKITLVTQTVSQPDVWSSEFWKEVDDLLHQGEDVLSRTPQDDSESINHDPQQNRNDSTPTQSTNNLIHKILLQHPDKICWDPVCIYAYLFPQAVETEPTKILVDPTTAALQIPNNTTDAIASSSNGIPTTIKLLQKPPSEPDYLSWIRQLVPHN